MLTVAKLIGAELGLNPRFCYFKSVATVPRPPEVVRHTNSSLSARKIHMDQH